MQITYSGPHQRLREAAEFATQLSNNEAFWGEVRAKRRFDYSDLDADEIVRRIRGAAAPMMVKTWRPNLLQKPFYRNTVAFFDAQHPNVLFYHTKFLSNSVAEMVHTCVHEFVHGADDRGEMGHGDDSAEGKENSAPYWIGNLAQRYYNAEAGGAESASAGFVHVDHSGSADDGEVVTDVNDLGDE